MKPGRKIATALQAGLMILAPPLFGQLVTMGSIVVDEVRDEYLQEGEQHQYMLVIATAGQVTIDLERTGGSGIDAFLTLRDARGNTIESNDDGGEGLNSRITRFLDAGRYSLEARDLGNNSAGTYRLSVQSASADRTSGDGTIGLGQTVRGYINVGEEARYSLVLDSTEYLVIDLERGPDRQLDPFLTVLDQNGNEIARDDDGGDGLDSRIEQTFRAGRYTVVGRDLGNNSAGEFVLSVQPFGGAEPNVGTIVPGSRQSVFINEGGTAELSLDLPRPAFLRIDLERGSQGSIDTYLTIYDEVGNIFASNDDGGDGFNSRLSQQFPAGRYIIEARDFGNNDAGEIIVSVQNVAGTADLPSIRLGESRVVQVPLGDAARLRFEATGMVFVEVSATARTTDVDPILIIRDAAGNQVERDDDGGPGLNSLISTRLDAGVYTFEVRDFASNDAGPVEVRVIDPGR